MKRKDLQFPIAPDDFVAYQEALIGRQLSENERVATSVWVPLFNDAYDAGLKMDDEVLKGFLKKLDQLLEKCENNSTLTRVLTACRGFTVHAFNQGRRAGQEVADATYST